MRNTLKMSDMQSCDGITDSSLFISRTRVLSGYEGEDDFSNYIPNDKFSQITKAQRFKTATTLGAKVLLIFSIGGIALFSLKALANWNVSPLLGTALCSLGAAYSGRRLLNQKTENFEFDANYVENPSLGIQGNLRDVYSRAKWLKEHNIRVFTKHPDHAFYELESFDWNMPNAYVFILGDDSHRASLNFDGVAPKGELYFLKEDVAKLIKQERELYLQKMDDREAEKARKTAAKKDRFEKKQAADEAKRELDAERLRIETRRLDIENERHQSEMKKERVAIEERKEALKARQAARLEETTQKDKRKTKRSRNRYCPRMLLVCYKKKYLDVFIALNLVRGSLVAQEKIYFDFLVCIHKNWDLWITYRDGDKNSDGNKAFKTLLEVPLNVMGDKNITRLRNVNKLNWRYLEDWLEDLDFIDEEELPQKGELPKANT